MSTLTLTFNEFRALKPSAHQKAVNLFTAEINHLRRQLLLDLAGSLDHADITEQIDLLVSLRKVHQGCLDELTENTPQANDSEGFTDAIAA
ncbi:MAG TPA: hypothetical protein VF690_16785 [Hymenobacter sp.]|jgi:hypothetical protein